MTPESIFREVMEVNFYGMVRTTKKFLPLVRKSKGRVVNVSSIVGKENHEHLGHFMTIVSFVVGKETMKLYKLDILVSKEYIELSYKKEFKLAYIQNKSKL